MNQTIQILRGTSANIVKHANAGESLLDGQLLYNTDKNYLTVGGGGNNSLTKHPISCRELVAYAEDDTAIAANKTTEYSIKLNKTSSYEGFKFNLPYDANGEACPIEITNKGIRSFSAAVGSDQQLVPNYGLVNTAIDSKVSAAIADLDSHIEAAPSSAISSVIIQNGKISTCTYTSHVATSGYADEAGTLTTTPSLAGTKNITITVGGKTSTAFTVPYATNALVASKDSNNNVIVETYSTKEETTQTIATAIENLINNSPAALDTLAELSTALGNDPNFATTMTNALAAKQPTITGGASTVTSTNLTASRALISNSSGKIAVSDVTSTELSYLDGITSNVQTQLNAKFATADIKTSIFQVIYPVGAIYITISKTFTPNTVFGGTWVKIEDAYLYAKLSDEEPGLTYGDTDYKISTSQLPAHTHTLEHTHQIPAHDHTLNSHTHKVTSNVTMANAQSNENYLYGKDAVLAKGNSSKVSVFQTATGSQVELLSNYTSYKAYTIDAESFPSEARNLSAFKLKLQHAHTLTNNAVTSQGPSTSNTGSKAAFNTTAASSETSSSVGSGSAYKPKYLAVIVWKRTA